MAIQSLINCRDIWPLEKLSLRLLMVLPAESYRQQIVESLFRQAMWEPYPEESRIFLTILKNIKSVEKMDGTILKRISTRINISNQLKQSFKL